MGILDRVAGTLDDLTQRVPAQVREEIALAEAFADRGDLDIAEQRLLDLAGQHPNVAAVFAALGRVRHRRGDDEGTVTGLGRAVDLGGATGETWLLLGEALARLGRRDPATDAFRHAWAESTDPQVQGRAHAALGRLHVEAGRLPRAVRELRKATALLPDDNEAAASLGRALLLAGEPDATEVLLRAAAAPEASPDLVVDAAAATADDGVADGLLRAALERAPGAFRVRAALSRRLSAAGRPAEALPLALECVAAAPDDPAGYRALREAHERAGDWAAASEAARGETARGGAVPAETAVRLALGARDAAALATLAPALPDGPLRRAVETFASGAADETNARVLLPHAPDEASRHFVLRALAPGPVPEGNIYSLLGYARDLAAHNPELVSLMPAAARTAEAFDRPLLVAIMGEFNAGKSSFVNALIGEEVAPVGVTPTTATINVLRQGEPGGRVLYHDGTTRELAAANVAPFLRGLSDADAAAVRVVEVFSPLDVLRRVEVVDTPGLNALRPEHERVAQSFLLEADAIVWLFSVGQAAKTTEKEALARARSARKRVLGVLNKADRATPDEIEAVRRHVAASLGDLVEAVVPMSARDAFAARRGRDGVLLATSGIIAVEAALEKRFFRHARALKRSTALAALERFVTDARATIGAPAAERDLEAERRALAEREHEVRGALAAERVALRARIDTAYGEAAAEMRDLVRPRTWAFGEHQADPADRELLEDLLEDAVARAALRTLDGLRAAAAGGPDVPLETAIDRFLAYARGVIEGGAVDEFFRRDLPRIRLDLGALRDALVRRAPDPEEPLFRPLDAAVGAAFRRARAELDLAEADAAATRFLREERLVAPLDALARAVEKLEEVTP